MNMSSYELIFSGFIYSGIGRNSICRFPCSFPFWNIFFFHVWLRNCQQPKQCCHQAMRCQRLGPGCWHVEGLDFGMSNSYFKHLKTNMALLKNQAWKTFWHIWLKHPWTVHGQVGSRRSSFDPKTVMGSTSTTKQMTFVRNWRPRAPAAPMTSMASATVSLTGIISALSLDFPGPSLPMRSLHLERAGVIGVARRAADGPPEGGNGGNEGNGGNGGSEAGVRSNESNEIKWAIGGSGVFGSIKMLWRNRNGKISMSDFSSWKDVPSKLRRRCPPLN